MSLADIIDPERLPQHIAVIMDGNGRWANSQGQHRIFGHQNGVRAVRNTTEACAELGVKYLTLYTFSTENWARPLEEVNALMELLVATIKAETDTLMKNKIKLVAFGELSKLPPSCRQQLDETIETTKNNDRLQLNLALSYSSRWELVQTVQSIAADVLSGKLAVGDITEDLISQKLITADIPDPELLIRTSGECRISNFLLWQLAYTELYFTDTFWPDFEKDDLYKAILDYQGRERRFGKTSDQIKTI
ncbi:MAG: isoprenyl transferase [Sphingobacteriaceae bacterium]|nr:isoprenyl transferase [Sphingobacteriaceae bacterium]